MDKKITLSEEQLRSLIQNTITETVNEVNWFQRAGQKVRNAWDNTKNQIGGAAAGIKSGVKYGGTTAAAAGRNDYLAKKNSELAQSRQEECDNAIAEFRKEYSARVGELNKWKANEIRQIKQMYGADAFANKARAASNAAQAARQDRAQFNQYDLNNQGEGQIRSVAESIEKIVSETMKKYLD